MKTVLHQFLGTFGTKLNVTIKLCKIVVQSFLVLMNRKDVFICYYVFRLLKCIYFLFRLCVGKRWIIFSKIM